MSQRAGVLIAHGFTGSPYELESFAAFLTSRGYTVRVPTLPGHDTTPDALRVTRVEDWLAVLRREREALARECPSVSLIGLSVGGSLMLKLAAEAPPAALVTIGAPVRMAYQPIMHGILTSLSIVMQDLVKPERGPFANEDIPGYIQRCYTRIPIRSMQRVLKFLRQEMQPALFQKITAPSLVIQGVHDPIVARWSSDYLVDHLAAQVKERLFWEDRYHLIVRGERQQELFAEVANWLEKHL